MVVVVLAAVLAWHCVAFRVSCMAAGQAHLGQPSSDEWSDDDLDDDGADDDAPSYLGESTRTIVCGLPSYMYIHHHITDIYVRILLLSAERTFHRMYVCVVLYSNKYVHPSRIHCKLYVWDNMLTKSR